jgi:CRISPR-associated protein Csb2
MGALRKATDYGFRTHDFTSSWYPGDLRSYALKIEFDQPLRSLIGFGYAAHFGLGLFVPVASPSR